MTQKELIEFCKENDPNYNKDAFFKVIEPMWSIPKGIGGVGITESEFKNGFYVQIDTKGRKGFEDLEGKVFYFRIEKGWMQTELTLYNSHWKKYFVPLDDLGNWGKEIVKEEVLFQVKEEDLVDKPTVFPIPKEVLQYPLTPEECYPLGTDPIVEEFPIEKIQGKTTYSKRNSFILIGKDSRNENIILQDLAGKEVAHTKESFSDLVDLMIEARKDLLK